MGVNFYVQFELFRCVVLQKDTYLFPTVIDRYFLCTGKVSSVPARRGAPKPTQRKKKESWLLRYCLAEEKKLGKDMIFQPIIGNGNASISHTIVLAPGR